MSPLLDPCYGQREQGDPDDPFASEPRYDHPESVEALRAMYEQTAGRLELLFPRGILSPVNQADSRELYSCINEAWCQAYRMSVALNWLLLGEVPVYYDGSPKDQWVTEYFHGPWPAGSVAP